MRKLLLFISMLFTLSFIGSANGMVLEDCGNNNYQFPGNCPKNNNSSDSPNYFGGIAVNPQTGE